MTTQQDLSIDYACVGNVHSFQSMGMLDGPGIRCVVFMQGCPLRCGYCHNPDTWQFGQGEKLTVQQTMEKVLKYRNYFGESGGLTVSGGEPLAQPEFVLNLFHACQQEKIHTVLDTSGLVMSDLGWQVLAAADLVILDLKFTSNQQYKELVGTDIHGVLEVLAYLNQLHKPVWLRQVIVPTINDDLANIVKLNEIIADFSCIKKVELLPFRKLCLEKYDNLGIDFPFKDVPEAAPEKIEQLTAQLKIK